MIKRIAPAHGLTLFFLIGLIIVDFLFKGRIPLWHSLLLQHAILLCLLSALLYSSNKNILGKSGNFFNDFSPIFFIILIYETLGSLIQYLWPDIDSCLIGIDYSIFGVHPTVWMEQWIVPWLTDVLSLAYLSYYFIPVVLIATLYLKGRITEFDQVIFILAFGYYLSFIGYILFPATGPRNHLSYSVPLDGSFITDFVRDSLNALEHNKRDCMPSGHTQMVLMTLFLARRHVRLLFYVLIPVVAALILSTVYLRYHYVIDLAVGALFAAGSLVIGPWLYKEWSVGSGK